jgi:phosphatidylglycerol lysyltransferase
MPEPTSDLHTLPLKARLLSRGGFSADPGGAGTAEATVAFARSRASSILKVLASLLGVLSFCLALVFLYDWMHVQRYDALRIALSTIPASSLILALVMTLCGYAVMTGYDFIALHSLGRRLPVATVVRTSFIANAFGNNFGNMLITGSAVRYWLYTRAGLPTASILRVAIFCSTGFWMGFLLLGGLDFLLFPAALPALLRWSGSTTEALGVIFLAVLAVCMTLLAWRAMRAPSTPKVPVPSPAQALRLIMIASADLCLMTSVFYVLLDQIAPVPFSRCLSMILLALVAGNLSFVPGGLGVFEAALVLQLAPMTSSTALASVLLAFRAIYYVLPLMLALALVGLRARKGLPAQWNLIKTATGRCLLAVAPQAVATTVFVAGALLLFSGAMPAASGRLDELNSLLALPFIEISHFIASLAGAALLLLAHALQRRLDAGWQLALALLGLGAGLSLLKGWDFEEASLLGLACLGLLPLRKQFYRRSSLLGQPFTRAWAMAIAAVLLASAFLVLFGHAQTPYADQPWWHFALHSEAPRSQRATIGAIALIALFSLYRLLRPVRPPLLVPDAAELARASAIARRSPATYANLVLRGDKALLFSPAGDAFLMYGRRGRCWVAMGEPVGPEDSARALLGQFHDLCDRFDGWCVLFEVSEKCRAPCADLGMILTPLGEEARVALTGFALDSPAKKKLREVRARLTRRGYRFQILDRDEVGAAMPALARVSHAWLAAKNTAEKGFSNASFDSRYLAQFPLAIVRSGTEIVAFANIWMGADKEELSIDLMRHLPTAANGTMDLLFCELMLWGRAEGFRWFNLGMAPLSNLTERSQSQLWPYLGTLLYRHGEHFYNFAGLRHYKEKFGPVWRPLYLASPGGLALPAILVDVTALMAGSLSAIVAKRGAGSPIEASHDRYHDE